MSTPVPDDEDEFTELVGATIPRVDLVDKAANGMTFLIAKSRDGAGLVDPAFVRDLIGKSQPEPAAEPAALPEGQVTMTGSPAAILSLIHDAAVRQRISKARTTTPPTSDGSEVSKAMADETTPALDPTVPLAAAEGDAPGNPTTPGSPAWEAIDAATARKWTAILARAQHAIGLLSEREMIEAASADPDDAFAAMDLDDAACAIEYAISVLAPFAVAEQAEADCASEEMAAVGKALGAFDPGPLDTIEALAHLRKAGRVLSSSNEAAIRSAAEQLQKVLASLPAAPTIPDGEAVTKETIVADTATPETPADDVTKATPATPAAAESAEPAAAPVVKEAQAAQVPVYDARGRLVGVTAPENVVPVESPAEEDAPAEEPADQVESEAVPAAVDLEPAPAAEVGIPADDVAKAINPDTPAAPAAPTDTPTDAESSIADIVKQALDAQSATTQQIVAELAKSVEELTKKVQTLEEQPAVPGMFSNGAVPPPAQLRGQDAGAPVIDDARARELRKGLYNGPDAPQQHAIANELNGLAIAALAEVHAKGPQR